jgi:hypothetical protein
VDKDIAPRAEEMLTDRESDALRSGGYERAFAEKFAHAGGEA